MQEEFNFETISHSQLSRKLIELPEEVLWGLFSQIVEKIQVKKPLNKRNHLYLIDSSAIPLNKVRYPWADDHQEILFHERSWSHPSYYLSDDRLPLNISR